MKQNDNRNSTAITSTVTGIQKHRENATEWCALGGRDHKEFAGRKIILTTSLNSESMRKVKELNFLISALPFYFAI